MRKEYLIALLIHICFVPFLGLAMAEEEESEKRGVIVNNEGDILEKITEKFPDVQQIIDACDEGIADGSISVPRDECVWDRVEDKDAIISALDNYSSSTRAPSADDENAPQFGYKQDNYKLKETKSIKKLEAYLKKRFEEALFGKDAPNNQLKVAQNHGDFYRVWQSQLGKNLIVQLSAYCMYSNPSPFSGLVPHGSGKLSITNSSGTEPTKEQAAKFFFDENIRNLGQANANGQSEAFGGFGLCIKLIAKDCFSGDPASNDTVELFNPKNPATPNKYERYKRLPRFSSDSDFADAITAVSDHSGVMNKIPHPCEINRYMTGVKKAIGEAEFLSNEMNNRPPEQGIQVNNIDTQRAPLNTDKVVNISSGEILEDEEYKDAVAEEAAELKECATSYNADCDKFLSDAEENKKIENEAFIRGLALKKKIERELTDPSVSDPEKLRDYFLEKGMSEDNFDRMLAQEKQMNPNKSDIEILKDLISTYYDNERKALQKSLKDRLEATEVADPSSGSAAAINQGRLTKIQSRVESSPEELAILYHYSNVVSSFIDVTGADGSSGKNTAALAAELENNYFDPGNNSGTGGSGRGTASGPSIPSDLSQLDGATDNSNGSDPSGNPSGATLGAGEIDQLQFGLGRREENPQ